MLRTLEKIFLTNMQINNVDDVNVATSDVAPCAQLPCIAACGSPGGGRGVLKPRLSPYALLCAHRSALPSGKGGTDGRTSTRSAPAWPAPCPSPPPPPVSAFTASNSPQQSELEGRGVAPKIHGWGDGRQAQLAALSVEGTSSLPHPVPPGVAGWH